MPINRLEIDSCYLCGRPLAGEINDDHVPPKQIYGKHIRRKHNPNILTLPVHKCCNRSFQHDEDYFVYSMSSMAVKTYSGSSVLYDIAKRHKNNEQRKLLRKVIGEWDHRPRGLFLPSGKVAKRIEGDRIHRVAWKIVRGLFFYNESIILSEAISNHITYVPPGERPPDVFFSLNDAPNRGQYPGVFDYRYKKFDEVEGMYYWAMLFWDAFMVLMAFHNPQCSCKSCIKNMDDT